ncbi:2-keto-4-pentenoate hydratase/2-oxohepta-3-ene-1,7-dioic acid hydratase [Caldisphaera lagunensis DSM 15908]|uniref:2-keto-4-pentenoate hydratase/2-oxohepta-3-ene-1,7-dioic acid hydratase n=1 Tax=Caldisphaera lagunensis (strain DSM 15908 / JCM 11604 / ANMR 0165 / IC-154) TaxID=1056495 RepID=L0ADY8_CALLD|nr:fumarylacetoacetate hydrolase family protein [Caldisphaera lagunensis]AFZ71270.1 2-keto-4-pentenoate hydratase/2-oxohepta-3-ene-1,7-dioic acid hydratase [Caldisphaera lagunensis DSM 15908]
MSYSSLKIGSVFYENKLHLSLFKDGLFYISDKSEINNELLDIKNFYINLPKSLVHIRENHEKFTLKTNYNLDSTLMPPNPFPSKIVGIGKNYISHAKEMKGSIKPAFFLKAPSALIGSNTDIVVPSFIKKPDYEGEVVILIGKKVKNASLKEAKESIVGYTAGNDFTARDLQYGDNNTECLPWSQAKSLDTFSPTGPYIKIIDDYSELENVCVTTRLNGKTVQQGCPSEMFYDYANVVLEVSKLMTLYPGDLVFTGTPSGVGHAKGNYLNDGDVIEVIVTGIDPLRNKVVRYK